MARSDDHDEGPALDAADEALVARLRALPPEGREPDWQALQSAIRAQVHVLPSPLPWWRNWRFLVPIGALAATAAIALLLVGGHRTEQQSPTATRALPHDASVTEPAESTEPAPAAAPALWLDGEAVELDETAALEALDGLDDEVAPADNADNADDVEAQLIPEDPSGDEPGILPGTDYGWIDTLDDAAIERAETWLARKRS